MTEERITQTTDPQGNTHTTHTIETGSSEGGAAKWAFLLILVIGLAGGAYLLTRTSDAEIARDNAITEAANEVGEAANQVGEAAQDAADSLDGE